MANQIQISEVKFTVGGAVQAGGVDATYLKRPADDELLAVCKSDEVGIAYVLACRQIGKSSLMYATAKKLSQEGIKTALIDITKIGSQTVKNADEWYLNFVDVLAEALKLDKKIKAEEWWEARPRIALTRRLIQFLREIVLTEITEHIVIFVDEIDITLSLDFADDFFAAIRTIYQDRAQDEVYRRLTFVLLGVATPNELIKEDTRTSFNIGYEITLRDFTKAECQLFAEAVKTDDFDQIYSWTRGHPYLTQKLCAEVLKMSEMSQPKSVDILVEELFLASEVREPSFQSLQSTVINDIYAQDMLRIYRRVLQGAPAVFDDDKSLAINKLKLYGLVVTNNRQLEVRNQIYARVFDISWAEEMLQRKVGLGLPKNYTIIQEIGQGRYATVYLARVDLDSDGSNKRAFVALKVLNPQTESKDERTKLIRRFEREARAAAKLNHPYIIRILETGRSKTGRADEEILFIAMEYIAGGTLREKLRTDPLRRGEALQIVSQIGEALAYAHTQGIIHRDVNPNNILLDTTDAEMRRAVLADFGLVKVLSEDHHTHTHTTSPVGTYRYMAPEQWQKQPSTPATDIYALAITFFEMLTGQYPFESGDPFELRDKHLHELLPDLSKVASWIGPFFDDALRKATAKKPEDRFQSMTEFIAALEEANKQAEQSEQEARRNRLTQLVKLAQSYLLGNIPDQALSIIEVVLKDDPENIDAWRIKGQIKRYQGQFVEALIAYRHAYEQTHNPDSEAGSDYLGMLKEAASKAWQSGHDQGVVEQYRVIKQILDEGRASGRSAEIWQIAWTELVEHYQSQAVKEVAYAMEDPQALAEAESILKRQIVALEALGANFESQGLRDKLRLLQIEHLHHKGSKAYADAERRPESIAEAVQILERVIEALKIFEAIPQIRDMQDKIEALQIKQRYIEGIRVYAGGKPENIAEAIRILERAIEVLENLKAHHEIQDLSSKLGELRIKQHFTTGEQAYAQGNPKSIVEAIEILENQIEILTRLGATNESQILEGRLWELQVKRHHDRGKKAFAEGDPENVAEAVSILEGEIEALDKLKATSESQDLRDKQKQLQVKLYKSMIETEKDAIVKANTQPPRIRFDNENIFQHYLKIDEIYQKLIELEDENKWMVKRRTNLTEKAKTRLLFAEYALKRKQPDYEAAIRNYQRILDVDQQHSGVAQSLDLSNLVELTKIFKSDYERLSEEIRELVEQQRNYSDAIRCLMKQLVQESDYENKYQDIRKLIEQENYPEAIRRLNQDFIRDDGNYEYRDVSRLFIGVAYAKKHKGGYPPDWKYLINYAYIGDRTLKNISQPWSDIVSIASDQNELLLSYENEIERIEIELKVAVNNLEEENPTIIQELSKIKSRLKNPRYDLPKEDLQVIADQIRAWLQQIDGNDANLQQSKLPDILKLLDELAEKEEIEKDRAFEVLPTVVNQIFEAWKVITEAQDILTKAKKELEILRQKENKRKLDQLQQYKLISVIIGVVMVIYGVSLGVFLGTKIPLSTQNVLIIWGVTTVISVLISWYVWSYHLSSSRNK